MLTILWIVCGLCGAVLLRLSCMYDIYGLPNFWCMSPVSYFLMLIYITLGPVALLHGFLMWVIVGHGYTSKVVRWLTTPICDRRNYE